MLQFDQDTFSNYCMTYVINIMESILRPVLMLSYNTKLAYLHTCSVFTNWFIQKIVLQLRIYAQFEARMCITCEQIHTIVSLVQLYIYQTNEAMHVCSYISSSYCNYMVTMVALMRGVFPAWDYRMEYYVYD